LIYFKLVIKIYKIMQFKTNEEQPLLNKDIIIVRDSKANMYYMIRTIIELAKVLIYIISIILVFNYYKN